MSITAPASTVLARATALLPQLRESALATEQARRVLPDTFDRHDRTIADMRNRNDAGTRRYSAQMHGACAARANATAKLRPCHL